jgi:hypothetical protein
MTRGNVKCQRRGWPIGKAARTCPPPASSSFLHKESLLDLDNITQPRPVCTKLHIFNHAPLLEDRTDSSYAHLDPATIHNRTRFRARTRPQPTLLHHACFLEPVNKHQRSREPAAAREQALSPAHVEPHSRPEHHTSFHHTTPHYRLLCRNR